MGESFGVIPLSNLRKYEGPETKNRPICDHLELHKCVKRFGCPNILGAQIPVVSNLKIDSWKFHVSDYWDSQLLDLLEFGFPLDFDTNIVLSSTEENHTSAKQFSSHVHTYIREERKHGAILGPFEHKPIPLHISPFLTRDKPDSDTRRTIVPFGYRHGSIFFEKVTDSIRSIMRKHGFPNLFNYVNGIIYCGTPSKIHPAFQFLVDLLAQLGLTLNSKKLVSPTTSMVCLGVLIDTETRTMSGPP